MNEEPRPITRHTTLCFDDLHIPWCHSALGGYNLSAITTQNRVGERCGGRNMPILHAIAVPDGSGRPKKLECVYTQLLSRRNAGIGYFIP